MQNDILASNLYLIIVKSISKSYGVPGLRLGILACGDIELIERIRKDLPIWNINSFAEFYMQIFGKYESDYKKACGRFISERKRFYQNLQRVDFYVLFLHKLIIFVWSTPPYTSKQLTHVLLNDEILVKDCSSKIAFNGKNYVRIAVRDRNDNDKIVKILKELSVSWIL